MEIKKRLITAGAQEVNAVMLVDEGEEYPVFLDSLHNTIIFPTLMESGYTLESLPYGFVKNGVKFTQLPVENYTLDAVQEEMMYNSIGVKLPYDELKKHIQITESSGMALPPTQYTIFTREDLIKYLEALEIVSSDDDFMPLNYFVAPDALYTLSEYKDIRNQRYIKLISNRRQMSLRKFGRLVDALRKINLPANYTDIDVVRAYFAWGMDGLKFTTLNVRTESRSTRLKPNRNVAAEMSDKTYGFVDGARNLLTPRNKRNQQWRLANKDPQFLDALTQGMQMNDTRIVEFKAPTKQEVIILEGKEFNIQMSNETLIMQLQSYPSLRVQSPVSINEFLELRLALPSNKEALYEYCTMDALAHMLYDYRKPTVKVSSFDALKIAGCNPKTVLDYICTKYDMSKDAKLTDENAAPQIFDFDIDNYLAGREVSEDVKSFLDDVVTGVFNIDDIENGKKAEASVNTVNVFREIYAIHNVMEISLEDIYDKFRTITKDMKSITFSNGEIQHTMDVSPLIYSITGYKRDLMKYDLQNARDCTFFTYVTLVAREVGDERAKRHVGMEFFFVNKKNKGVQEILSKLETAYTEKVHMMIPDAVKQTAQMRLMPMFTLSRYFEIALKGSITWPAILGGVKEPALPSDISLAQKYLERRIENITAFCQFTARTENSNSLTFNAYCTNAYITPEYIIPRSDAPIHEIPFFAAWYDWKRNSPETFQALVNANVFPANFESWESRYATEQFVQRDLFELDSMDSLLYYYTHANEEIRNYPVDKDFISVHHPMEYMFPGLTGSLDEFEDCDTLPVPRTADPVVRLGIVHDLVKDDYADKLLPSESLDGPDSYIKHYNGFGAEMFMIVPDLFERIPEQVEDTLTVMAKSGSIYVSDTGEVINFRRITELNPSKYPICHVCDRTYLLRSADGKLWEVRI